jgi:PD-(D/E)XK nuclease superfamily
MSQKIISIDSSILNVFQSCARKAKYSFVDNLHPPEKAEALEVGDLMHKMLEIYYSLQINSFKDKELFKEIREAGISPFQSPQGLIDLPNVSDLPAIKDLSVKSARYFATKMSLPSEEVEETVFQFSEYADYYAHDSWCPLAVEEVGSKVLFESEDLKIIYNFKIDLIAEQGRTIAPFDHKTARRRQEPSSLSNQFIGYCYGLNLNSIVINKIGFQKTLTPKERFNRFILTISDERIKEWIDNTVWWVKRLQDCLEFDYWPMDLTSCDKYSGCIFMKLCESDPESRLYKIERDYKVEAPWDVAKHLEVK